MLPGAALPYSALTLGRAAGGKGLARVDAAREQVLDRAPPAREVAVAFGQRPDRMHVVRQDDPGVDASRGADAPHRVAQVQGAVRQQGRPN